MNAAIWRSLLWKEWREHRWKLAALVVVAIGLHVWAIAAPEPGDGQYAMPMIAMLTLVLPIGSVLIATGLAAGEQSQRTAPFLQSLPIDLKRAAATKLVVGIAVIVVAETVALALTLGLSLAASHFGWESSSSTGRLLAGFIDLRVFASGFVDFLWSFFLIVLTMTISLTLWITAPALNSASEVRAGAIGLAVVVGCWTLCALGLYLAIDEQWMDSPIGESIVPYFLAMLPGGVWPSLRILEGQASQLLVLVPFLLSHIPLAWWYVTRFGTRPEHGTQRKIASTTPVSTASLWLRPPRRTPLQAILWKQARECAPIFLTGGACAIALSISLFVLQADFDTVVGRENLAWVASHIVLIAFAILGCCAGLVSGAGILTTELEPRLCTFWRSRPISVDLWYASAFVGGLVLLLIVFGGPIALARQIETTYSRDTPSSLLLISILVLSYASGVFTAAFLRNAVYASLTGLGVMGAACAVAFNEWQPLPEAWQSPLLLATSTLLGVAAWVCVRNDWSLRLS